MLDPHPMLHAFMSSQDIVQLYHLRREDDNSFGIVLSPRREGVKALCVHLTDEEYERMKSYEAIAQGDLLSYASARIKLGYNNSFYCQIPFLVRDLACSVVDLRTTEEVVGQLSAFIPFASENNFR